MTKALQENAARVTRKRGRFRLRVRDVALPHKGDGRAGRAARRALARDRALAGVQEESLPAERRHRASQASR